MTFGSNIRDMEEYVPQIYTPGMIRLDANESYADMPDEMKNKVLSEISAQAFNRYPDPAANALCKAFADYYGLYAANVVAGNGSDELISIMCSSLLSSHSRVLVIFPDFSVYKIYANLYENTVITVDKDENLNFDVEKVISVAKSRAVDLIIFSNPCNPTGQGITAKEAETIISSVNCAVCVDEAYMEFWTDNETVLPLINKYDNLIVLKTFSKAFGMAAFRLGFAIAGMNTISLFRKAKMPYNVSVLSQAAGLAALKNREYLKNMTSQIIARKNMLYQSIKPLEAPDFRVFDTKTNFITVKTSKASEIHDYLLSNNISVRYISPDFLRITAGTRGENDILKTKLEAALNETGIH
jgi:histidinol-phosphate aminotransferase